MNAHLDGTFFEPSPYRADGGNAIGRDPRSIPAGDLRRLGHPESPIKAIRAKCLDCCAGNEAEVRKCISLKCPLWPMRMGVSTFHKASGSAKLEVANLACSEA